MPAVGYVSMSEPDPPTFADLLGPTPVDVATELAAVEGVDGELARLDARALELRRQRRAHLLRASRAGATYPELAAASGLSRPGVAKLIRQARAETEDPLLAARVPRTR